MKIYVTASLVLILTCGSAAYADVAVGPYNWTGFYAGLNLGWTMNDSSYNLSPTGKFSGDPDNPLRTDSGDFNGPALTAGGQFGYNYQISRYVLGLETDLNYNGFSETLPASRTLASPLLGDFSHTVTQKIDYFGTVRGRLGFTPCNRLLVYATGGFAYGHVSSNSDLLFSEAGDHYAGSSTTGGTGWAVGGGVEYALNRCWSVRLEYLFIDLGSKSYTYGNQLFPGYTYTTQLDTSEHAVRIGLNYRF
jgi:outer membrane immunogenic protein